ncbi:putative KilA-N domain-containing protein [Cotonvirus japonicus]|uniref:KilA-N domain-containing protein n=1 Tax=Cotonvirus japonicus TaxID=2811091 RepID=A0ABM7NQS9_9VIRU|nr:putative KilA-N domain-containing protein [Cotonvirus japonicus]BCS82505.1 putative KilA-N domain-containing protein [Cotonvirus japonicus]
MPSKTKHIIKSESKKSNNSSDTSDYELSDYDNCRVIKKSNKKIRKTNVKPLKKFSSKRNENKNLSGSKKFTSKSKKLKKSKKVSSESESSSSESSDSESSHSENSGSESSDSEEIEEKSSDEEINESIELNNSDIDKNLSKKIVKNDKETDIKNIIFERINNEYYRGKYGDFDVIMDNNGYVNVTKLCNEAVTKNGKNKEFRQWKKTSEAKELMDEISKITKIPASKLLIQNLTSSENITRGSYAHPMLVTHIASWISPKFSARVNSWIEEWKLFSKNNNYKYFKELGNLKPSMSDTKEKNIQLKLRKKYKGKLEVKTKSGHIDLLTNKYLIEIKNYQNWKHAIGQLMVYSIYFPKKIKCLYLFGVGSNDLGEIKKVCKKYDIVLKIYD